MPAQSKHQRKFTAPSPFSPGMANLPRASVFLRDKLFRKSSPLPPIRWTFRSTKGRRSSLPIVRDSSAGTAVPRERQQLRLFSPPFMKPVRTLTADDVFYRSMGIPGANTR